MKIILPLLFTTAISSVVIAENNLLTPQPADPAQTSYIIELPTEYKESSKLVVAENEANNLDLWNMLDANNDESISKSEAASSEEILQRWTELDSNKDDKLDFIEFSRMSTQKM